MTTCNSKIIVALDYSNERDTCELVDKLDPASCRLKVGKQLFTSCGPQLVKTLINKSFEIFLDLKFHDIPVTVEKSSKAAADLGVWMFNVHAMGGQKMMESAKKGAASGKTPLIVAVTVLTSNTQEDLKSIGFNITTAGLVSNLAKMTKQSGLDGVVCSAQEAKQLRVELGSDFVLVTPGIRNEQSEQHDQKRVMTARNAVKAGSDYLVIGRPITHAKDPMSEILTINSELSDF